MASFVAFLVLAGSIYMFVNLFKENQFRQSAQHLIDDIKESGISIIDEVDKNINFDDIAAVAYKNAKKILQDVNLFDVYENEERLGKGKKSYAVSFVFQDDSKTLKDKDIEKVMGKLIKTYEHKMNAVIRK